MIVYAMGFLITMKSMENSFDMVENPLAAMMWPLLILALFIDWLEGKWLEGK